MMVFSVTIISVNNSYLPIGNQQTIILVGSDQVEIIKGFDQMGIGIICNPVIGFNERNETLGNEFHRGIIQSNPEYTKKEYPVRGNTGN